MDIHVFIQNIVFHSRAGNKYGAETVKICCLPGHGANVVVHVCVCDDSPTHDPLA